MARERALQNEASPIVEQILTANYRLPGGRDRRASRSDGFNGPGNGVRIDHAPRTFESESGGQCALPGAVWPGNQSESRHFKRRLKPVRAARCGAIPEVVTGQGGSRSS